MMEPDRIWFVKYKSRKTKSKQVNIDFEIYPNKRTQ